MKSKKDIGIMKAQKREKNKNAWKSWNSKRERERERELLFKPTTKENLVLFVVLKLYIKYQSLKDGLCKKNT